MKKFKKIKIISTILIIFTILCCCVGCEPDFKFDKNAITQTETYKNAPYSKTNATVIRIDDVVVYGNGSALYAVARSEEKIFSGSVNYSNCKYSYIYYVEYGGSYYGMIYLSAKDIMKYFKKGIN